MEPLERPDLLTPREAANMLGITVSTIANLSRQGQITALPTPGGHRRYTREEIERVKAERTVRPSDAELQLAADVVRLYQQGWSIRQVAKRFGFGYGKTRRLLIRHTILRARSDARSMDRNA